MSNVPTGITAYRNQENGKIAGSYPQPGMTDREILKLASDMASNQDGFGFAFYHDALLRFARAIGHRMRAEEREACARECEEVANATECDGDTAHECVVAIRERAALDPRFANVSCSQCGRDFGPGDHGFSHCEHHGF